MAVPFTVALDWREPAAADLLRDYAGRFGRGDDATLVIHGGSASGRRAVAAALGDDSPEMVLVEQVEPSELEPRIDAVLSPGPAHGAWRACPGWSVRPAGLYDLRLAPYPAGAPVHVQPLWDGGVAETQGWPRDTATCPGCGSAARFRGLADLVARELFGSADPLYALPPGPTSPASA